MSQAQKTQKPPQKPAPALATAAPMLKDPLVKKTEIKPKTETTGSFQAFKRTEVKVSVFTPVQVMDQGSQSTWVKWKKLQQTVLQRFTAMN